MKVIIFGAYGFLGRHLSKFLESSAYTILRVGSDITSDICYSHTDGYVTLSLILQQYVPDVIINLLALTDVDECEKSPNSAYKLNTNFPACLKRCLVELVKDIHVIHISTDQIYSGHGPHVEEKSNNPLNTYGLTKLFGEYEICSQDSLILRTNFVGKSLVDCKVSFSDWIVYSLKSGSSIKGYNNIYFSPLHISSPV